MPEQETTVRADETRTGDRIEYAGAWRTIHSVTTVTTINADGLRLDYEPYRPLTVRRPGAAPAETSAEEPSRA